MMYWLGGWNNIGGWGMMGEIFMMIFWILIVAAIIWFLTRGGFGCCSSSHHNHDSNTKDDGSALKILKERYAKGEIDKKEFEEKKKDLEN